jgi:AraC-like DNA-binding protein
VELVELDLGSLASVERAARQVLAAHPKVDLLINNAGVMAMPQGRTADGFETQLGINHLTMPDPPRDAAAAYEEYLGVPLRPGPASVVVFGALDARRPFLTENAEMWQVFEPELRRRLADLDRPGTTIAEIAFLLGYDEPSSFHRAFHQWSGITPQQARRRIVPAW